MQRPSEPPPDVEIAQAGTPAEPRDVTVIMRDYRFDPTPVVLVPGETVRFTILNGGLVDHDFVIGDEAVQRAWHAADAAATPPALLATAPPASVPPETGGLRVLLGSGQQASWSTRCRSASSWPSCATSPATSRRAWWAPWTCGTSPSARERLPSHAGAHAPPRPARPSAPE